MYRVEEQPLTWRMIVDLMMSFNLILLSLLNGRKCVLLKQVRSVVYFVKFITSFVDDFVAEGNDTRRNAGLSLHFTRYYV